MKKLIIITAVLIGLAENTINAQSKLTSDVFASYYGGIGGDYMTYVACDMDGNVIITGHGGSKDLPTLASFQNKNNLGPSDGFIAKFNPAMNQLIFSTYLGGTKYDEIKDVVVDSAGNIYVTGITESSDFPVTHGTYDSTINGEGKDAFLSKFSPEGDLLYSTFLGGSKEDIGMRIAIISSDIAVVTGSTSSNDFPDYPALTDTIKGGTDVFLLTLNLTTSELSFSTRFGGSDNETAFGVKTDNSHNIYVCGHTKSSEFPVKAGFNNVYSGKQDGFICKFDNNGELIYSSFIGGSEADQLVDLVIDNKNEVYFIGGTGSSELTCTPNAFSTSKKGLTDCVLGKVNAAGDSLKYFSYFGGNNTDNLMIYNFDGTDFPYCYGKIDVIGDDKIVIAGKTNSTDFQISRNGYSKKAEADMFVSVLNIASKEALYFSYFGSPYDDDHEGLSVLNDSVIFISGNVGPGIPVSAGAYMTTYKDSGDVAFARFIFKNDITTSVEKITTTNNLKIWPNPSNGLVNISLIAIPCKAIVEIYNTEGKLILSDTSLNSTTETIDLTGHPKGIYLVKIDTGTEIFNEKIIKN